VLAAYYCPEALSIKAEKAIASVESPVISPLVQVEFSSALSRKIREKSIRETDAKKIWTRFSLHRDQGLYDIREISMSHYSLAEKWLVTFKTTLRALDALHLAFSFETQLLLITGDKALAGNAELLGVKAHLIR
jgi:predicted nucleic acid-binding protein